MTASRNEQRFRDFAEASSDWFWEMDENCRFSYLSERFTEVTGLPQEVLLGKTREETELPGLDPDLWRGHLADLAARRSFRDFSHPRTLPDGRVAQLSVNGKAIFDSTGAFKGYRGTARDVTDQAQAEGNLRWVNALFDETERLAKLGHWEWDEIEDRCIYCSAELARLHGVTVEEYLEQVTSLEADLEWVQPEDRGRYRALVEDMKRQCKGFETEYRLLQRDGGWIEVREVTEVVIDDTGTVARSYGFMQDITERKRAEAALRETQQELLRKERLATLGQLTGTVSHELRNPLAAIRNTVFMINEMAQESGLDLDRLIARVERSISRCDQIVAELLDFTRTSSVTPQPEVLDSWLDGVLKEQKTPDSITLHKELDTDGLVLEFDPDRIRRAVINVHDNACQAMTEAAERDAEAPELSLTVQTRSDKGRAELRFIDTGPGMAPEVLSKIFEPLYSTKSFGVGLGMPTVKQVMEQHGGGIEVSSDPGLGTTVVLWLPVQRKQEEAA